MTKMEQEQEHAMRQEETAGQTAFAEPKEFSQAKETENLATAKQQKERWKKRKGKQKTNQVEMKKYTAVSRYSNCLFHQET